jgi:hypothetical protein
MKIFLIFFLYVLILTWFGRNFSFLSKEDKIFVLCRTLSLHQSAVTPFHHKEWVTIFIAIAWNIWLARNRKVFDNINTSSRRLEDCCWSSLALWAFHNKKLEGRQAIQNWVASRTTGITETFEADGS